MNNIIFQTNLLRGAQGPQGDTGTAEAIPSDAVVWYDGNEAPAGFVETTAPSGISSIQNAVDVVSARVDKIEALPDGSTTADAELVDIRVGADGTSYASAGNAVRGQVTALDDKIDNTNETQDYTISANSIVGTAEGNPITITDGGNCNARKLIATISPTQSGTGDPSPTNVRPISGVSTLNVNRAGKNLCPMPTFSSAITYAIQPTNKTDLINLINSLPAGNYIISAKFQLASRNDTSDNSICGFVFTGVTEWAPVSWGTSSAGATKKATISFAKTDSMTCSNIYFYGCGKNTVGATGTAILKEFQIELGSTATSYEPYQGTTISLSLGSTVYGGNVDLNTGVLTVDRVGVTFDGSEDENWSCILSNNHYRGYTESIIDIVNEPNYSATTKAICDKIPSGTWDNVYTGVFKLGQAGKIVGFGLDDLGITTVEDLRTWLSSNNLHIVYPLATPTTTQLTPQSLRLLQGNNTLWTNAEGLEVEYVKDATIIINDILSRLEALEG